MLSCRERAASQRACMWLGLQPRLKGTSFSAPHRAAPYWGDGGGRSGELASVQEAATYGGYRERGEARSGAGGYGVMIVGCKLGAKHGERRLSPSGGGNKPWVNTNRRQFSDAMSRTRVWCLSSPWSEVYIRIPGGIRIRLT